MNDLCFSSNQDFGKVDYVENKVAVGCNNGVVKIYDIRMPNKRSINNFTLKSSHPLK